MHLVSAVRSPHLAFMFVATAVTFIEATPEACPLATPADFAAYPSTLRTIQPESLFTAGTQTKCPGPETLS